MPINLPEGEYRQPKNPSPERQKALVKIMAKMRSEVQLQNKKNDEDHYNAERIVHQLRINRALRSLVMISVLLFSSGCPLFDVFTPTQIVKHPDAPMLIIEQNGEWVHVSAYSKTRNAMIDVGWVKPAEGWTLVKYDWEAIIARRRAELDN